MVSRLHIDVLMQNKLLISGLILSLTLKQSNNAFQLFGARATDYKLNLVSAILQVRRASVTGATLLNLEKYLQNHPAKYPISHSIVKTVKNVHYHSTQHRYLQHFRYKLQPVQRNSTITWFIAEQYQS